MRTLLVFLLFTACASAELSPRLDSLRVYVTDKARLSSSGDDDITLAKINREINFAIQQTCQDFPAVEKYDTLVIDSTMEGGTLPSDFHRIVNVSFMLNDVLRIPIRHLMSGDSIALKDNRLDENQQERTDTMSIKSWRVHNTILEVHPKWSRGDTALYLLQYYALDSNLTTDSSVTQVRAKYRDKVVLFAVSRLWALRSNFAYANFWMREYEKGLVKNND
jgi:hypothetical protein